MNKITGLTDEQAVESRRRHGGNALTELKTPSLFHKILMGFLNPMILILVVALLIQVILFLCKRGEWYEPMGIWITICLANGVAAVFEHHQEFQATALKRQALAGEMAKIYRNGVLREIPMTDVVVGDWVRLQAGDRIPADGVLRQGQLRVNQAALNGESEEAEKISDGIPPHANKEDINLLEPHSLFRGTIVCVGEAIMEVQAVGDATLYGQMALATQEMPRTTPLQIKLAKLAIQISKFGYMGGICIVAAILLTPLMGGNSPDTPAEWFRLLFDAITIAVTVIICAVPEGLPMLNSILQALQSLKMVKSNVLVRKIHGLETAGSLSLLFCDKTGTLTEGQLTLTQLIMGNGQNVSWESLGNSMQTSFTAGIGMNNSALPDAAGKAIGGNSTDRALLDFLLKKHIGIEPENWQRLEYAPFDSSRKDSRLVARDSQGMEWVFLKGMPEKILAYCTYWFSPESGKEEDFSEELKANLERVLNELASRSMRLLAIARRKGTELFAPASNWTLLGIVVIRDNVRSEVPQTVDELRLAGIQVVMVTGDREDTAIAIARESRILSLPGDVTLTSGDLNAMPDEELKRILPRLRVVARALPLDKSRLVKLAQELGYVVGMTGDGVNDAPALRKADVGFAMGSGTEVAKEAGEITILDDNLASIKQAILYGRTMFKSIRRFLIFQLSVNVSAVLICSIAPLFGIEKVMSVVQLLIVNLAMDTLAAMAYGGEPPRKEYMQENPVPREENIITRRMMQCVLSGASYITLLCLSMLLIPQCQQWLGAWQKGGLDMEYLRSAIFAMFMMAITWNGFQARTSKKNFLHGLGGNKIFLTIMTCILLFQWALISFGGKPLGVEPLSFSTWSKCILLSLGILLWTHFEKMLRPKQGKQ